MSFNAIRENKILTKISGFTVTLSRPMEFSIKLYTIMSEKADSPIGHLLTQSMDDLDL